MLRLPPATAFRMVCMRSSRSLAGAKAARAGPGAAAQAVVAELLAPDGRPVAAHRRDRCECAGDALAVARIGAADQALGRATRAGPPDRHQRDVGAHVAAIHQHFHARRQAQWHLD